MSDIPPEESVCIVWSSRDKDVALNMVFMYAANALIRGWFKRSRLVVWGPSAKILCEDAELQQELQFVRDAGVELLACHACAERYHVAQTLQDMGVDVIYMGEPLTTMLKQGWKILTF